MKYNLIFLFLLGITYIQCTSEKPKPKTNTVLPETINQISAPDPIPEYIDLAFVMGKFTIENHHKIVKIDPLHADNANRYMHVEAYDAFKKMHTAAAKEGVQLKIRSAARNFDYQKGIWERKWSGATLLEGSINAAKSFDNPKDRAVAILKYSSMPGSSRHHWGTDIDINAFDNSYFEKGDGKKVYEWMLSNAHTYGYCQPYTQKGTERPNGYEEEKWHWSFLPVANDCLRMIKKEFKNELITGFVGSEQATALDVYTNFIFGINKSCLD